MSQESPIRATSHMESLPYRERARHVGITFSLHEDDVALKNITSLRLTVGGILIAKMGLHRVPIAFEASQSRGKNIVLRHIPHYFDWSVGGRQNGFNHILEIPEADFPQAEDKGLQTFLQRTGRADRFNKLVNEMSSREAFNEIAKEFKLPYRVFSRRYRNDKRVEIEFKDFIKFRMEEIFPRKHN